MFDPVRQAVLLVGGDKAGNWQGWYRTAIPIARLSAAWDQATEWRTHLAALSTAGRWVAWPDPATGRLALVRPDGTERRTVELADEGDLQTVLAVDDVSPDGRQVSLVGTVAGISSSVRRVVDTTTGKTVRFLREPVQQTRFLHDGTLLLDTGGQLALIDPKAARLLWQNKPAPEEAALNTFTGKMAARYGSENNVIASTKGPLGECTDVVVRFVP